MSKRNRPSVRLSDVLRAFLGEAEAGCNIIGNALSLAVTCMAQHGTDGPIKDACALLEGLTGKSTREKALKAGYTAIKGDLLGIAPGKSDAAAAHDAGERIGAAFVLAVGEVLSTPVVKAEVEPADILARVATKVAKVKDADVSRFLATQAGRDMFARLTGLAAAAAAAESSKDAARKARAPVDKVASVPAVGAPLGEPVKVAA